MTLVGKYMDLDTVILSEVTQVKKDKLCLQFLICVYQHLTLGMCVLIRILTEVK